jgi:hypothetical protein
MSARRILSFQEFREISIPAARKSGPTDFLKSRQIAPELAMIFRATQTLRPTPGN